MTRWFPNSIRLLLYRTVQRCVQALPASLLRVRPFGVYEIRLSPSTSRPVEKAMNPARQVRWIGSHAEADRLGDLATAENIATWNGTTRRAAAVWQNDQPVAVAWIATESFTESELGLHFLLDDDEAWLFAAVVAPALRRQGLYQQLLEFVKPELAHNNSTPTNYRILLGVSNGNLPSQKAHGRQGAKQLGTIFAIKSLGLSFCQVGGQVRQISRRPWAWRRTITLAVER